MFQRSWLTVITGYHCFTVSCKHTQTHTLTHTHIFCEFVWGYTWVQVLSPAAAGVSNWTSQWLISYGLIRMNLLPGVMEVSSTAIVTSCHTSLSLLLWLDVSSNLTIWFLFDSLKSCIHPFALFASILNGVKSHYLLDCKHTSWL